MNAEKTSKDDILALAEKAKHNCNLLINQCENWLPEEEGLKNIRKKLKLYKKFSSK
jgi:hypothetical protein